MLDGSRKRVSSVICMSARHIVSSVLWSRVFRPIPYDMDNVCLYAFLWLLIHYCAILWLFIWTQIPRVHSSVVRAADCRSAGLWFNSGWRSWFTFVTGSDNLTNPTNQMINSMSPITRNSVKKKQKERKTKKKKKKNSQKKKSLKRFFQKKKSF